MKTIYYEHCVLNNTTYNIEFIATITTQELHNMIEEIRENQELISIEWESLKSNVRISSYYGDEIVYDFFRYIEV